MCSEMTQSTVKQEVVHWSSLHSGFGLLSRPVDLQSLLQGAEAGRLIKKDTNVNKWWTAEIKNDLKCFSVLHNFLKMIHSYGLNT